MRIITNHQKVQRNRRIAQYSFFATLALLILGLFVTNAAPQNPILIFAPLLVLPIAIAATFYSVRMANLWLREPRPETTLADQLKGLSSKSVLYNYIFPARHVLITPQGVFTFTIRPQDGKFTIEGGKWRKQGNLFSRFMTLFRQDTLGRPDLEAEREAREVQALIDRIAPDSGVQVEPVVVFTSPYASFEVIDAAMPVLYASTKSKPNLKTFVRDLKQREKSVSLTEDQIAALEEAVGYTGE